MRLVPALPAGYDQRMRAIHVLRVALVACALAAVAAEEPAPPEIPRSELPSRLDRLARMREPERTLLLHELAFERQRVFEVLIRSLDAANTEARLHAAFLLGQWRLDQAAPHLARQITLRDEHVGERGLLEQKDAAVWFWGEYPAQEALIRLGKAAVPSLIELLGRSDDEDTRRLAAAALSAIEGPLARTVLALAARDELDPPRRDRLVTADAWFAPPPP
ncbi:MAG: hypothetical protein H0W72_05520 [Planctomycetes bacterium]|nr:hypothetical protein [Planctomycetota bacterium]